VYANNFPSVPPEEGGVPPGWAMTQSQYVENGELVVPPGHFLAWATIAITVLTAAFWIDSAGNLIGRPMFIYWSFETPADQYEHTAFSDRIGFLLHTVLHFFDMTRWSRTSRWSGELLALPPPHVVVCAAALILILLLWRPGADRFRARLEQSLGSALGTKSRSAM